MTSICVYNANIECGEAAEDRLGCSNCLRAMLVVELRRLRVTGIRT